MTNHVQLELTSHLRPARCLFASKPSYHSFLFVTIYSCTHLNSLRCELEPSLGSHQEEQLFLLPLLEPVYKHVTKMNGITLYIYKQKPGMFIKTIKETKTNTHTHKISASSSSCQLYWLLYTQGTVKSHFQTLL